MQYLSTAEYAEVKGLTLRHTKRLCAGGKIQSEQGRNSSNRPMYLIPLSELSEREQLRWIKQHGGELTADAEPKEQDGAPERSFDSFTAEQRYLIVRWQRIVEDWQEYCAESKLSKAEATTEYVNKAQRTNPDLKISEKTLYRRSKSIKDGDFAALVDNRGLWKRGSSTVPDEAWTCFMWLYLNQNRPPLCQCYDDMRDNIQMINPELYAIIPSEAAFRRRLNNESQALIALGRYGEKYYRDRYAPYLSRDYSNMFSNDYWVADTYTLDIRSKNDSGTLHRLYLSAFLDARSGIFTGWYITDSPSSQATLIALRRGINKHGIPKNIYVDNGREYLTFDLGGKGHRAKKSDKEKFSPPPIFERLGIKMTNAIVRNGRAKLIERFFKDIKESVAKLFDTYTGGNVTERPERLKAVERSGNVISDKDLIAEIDLLIEGDINYRAYNGAVSADKGKSRIEVYREQLKTKRVASDEELALMLMRSTRSQKVGRRGVTVTVYGERLEYWTDEFLYNYAGKQVYVRYDPDNLNSVRVYDLEDSFICELPRNNLTNIPYGVSNDTLKAAMRNLRTSERYTKNQLSELKRSGDGYISARELHLMKAASNLENDSNEADARIIELQRSIESAKPAAGGEITVDKAAMIASAQKRTEE